MRFFNFTLFGLTTGFTAGIIIAAQIPTLDVFLILPAGLIGLLGFWFANRKRLNPDSTFAFSSYLLFSFLGYAYYQTELPQNQEFHYSHFTAADQYQIIHAKVRQVMRSDSTRLRLIARVDQVGQEQTHGLVVIYVNNNADYPPLRTGDQLLFTGRFSRIQPALNPHQFDYAAYMATLHVYHQVYVERKNLTQHSTGSKSMVVAASYLRAQAEGYLDRTQLSASSNALLKALILGNKEDIEKDLYSKYAAAGAVHILAVSGLHVGIIYMLLSFLMYPLTYLRFGYQAKYVLIVLALWSYAFITGLSPSVSRSVCMFSCFALAKLINRPTNSINTLCLSWLILLVGDPFLLFRVGFQLSYAAVFTILWIQPRLAVVFRPSNYIVRAGWDIITVSTAAQLGVMPLSLYYFNQFPGLFLLSNLVLLPFLSAIVTGGIILILLRFISVEPVLFEKLLDSVLLAMNEFIKWIASRESFLITDIHPDLIDTIALAFFVMATCIWINTRKKGPIKFSLVLFILIAINNLPTDPGKYPMELIIFHRNNGSAIALKQGSSLLVLKRDSLDLSNRYPIKSFSEKLGIKRYREQRLPNFIPTKNQGWIIIDSAAVYPGLKGQNVLLIESSRINFERMIDSLKPDLIVADGSNRPYLVKKWKETAQLKNMEFYFTGQQGAFTKTMPAFKRYP